MAKLIVRVLVNFLIGGAVIVLSILLIYTILLLVVGFASLVFLLLFIPLWLIILIIERELIWTFIFLLKKAPFKNLSKTSRNHENLLENYLTKKDKELN